MVSFNILKDPLPKLFRDIGIPISIGMFFQTMYNVVDTYFAGLHSTEALAALSVSFPVFFILMSVAMGVSQGSSTLIANALGAKKKTSDIYVGQSMLISLLVGLVLVVLGLLFAKPLFLLLGADGLYLDLSLSYMNIIILAAPIIILSFAINGVLSAHGDTSTLRNAMIGGFILNVVFDPWFMFGGFGVPAMGIQGIALATIIIMFLEMTYKFIIMKRYVLNLHFQASWVHIKEIFHQAYPISLNRLLVALGIFIITYFVGKFGPTAIAAYGTAVRIEQIFLLPSVGISVAVMTLIGQNNGAKKFLRIKEVYYLALKYGAYLGVLGGVLMMVLRTTLMSVFTDDPAVIKIGSDYLFVASFLLWFYVANFSVVSFYQGIKKPLVSLWTAIGRQVLAPLILFPLFSFWFKLPGMWYSIAITIIGGAIIMLIIGHRAIKKLVG